MISRHHARPEFFARAAELRAGFEAHFAQPLFQSEISHGIWNYWFVRGQYTFFRATPERVFGPLADEFTQHLAAWSREELGLTGITPPSLNLYLNGCGQSLHNDFHTGIWGYVYSLTADGARFSGGETLLLRDGSPNYKRHHSEGDSLYELIPPRFNQLLVFDDRLAHAVTPVQGTMDPLDGRVVLVGHVFGGVTIVDGPLPRAQVEAALAAARRELARATVSARDVHGMISIRLMVGAGGQVSSTEILFNHLVATRSDVPALTELIVDRLSRVELPAGPGRVTVPLLLPIVENPPIVIERRHTLPLDDARRHIDAMLDEVFIHALVAGHWQSDERFSFTQPSPGSIELDHHRLRLALEPLAISPSQWAQLDQVLNRELAQRFPG